jgi:Zn finger protein HypA/HybF involved in hydrogenase expression
MASKLYDYTPAELQKLLDESTGYADVLRKIGLNAKGGNPKTLKKIICEYNLDETTLDKNRSALYSECAKNVSKKITYSLEDIFNGKYPNYQSAKLLQRLIQEGYKENKCERCGITEWCGLPITFQLHHKDGDHTNNNLCNLEVLCPNCHSQTNTYGGKSSHKNCKPSNYEGRLYDEKGGYKILCPVCNENFMMRTSQMCKKCRGERNRKPKVSKEELFKIMETNTYDTAAQALGVDAETVSRWHKYYVAKDKKEKQDKTIKNDNKRIGSDKAPTREVLKKKIRTMSFLQIGKEYDVSDNAIRKWCDTYGLPRHASEIKSISDEDWEKI